jgi:hypothetical protein
MFNVPGEAIALILGIDRILDMSRTTVNVIGDMLATTFVARSEGLWTPAMVPAIPMLGVAVDESPNWPGPNNTIGQ